LAAALWPLPLRAQRSTKIPRLGVLLYSTLQGDPNTEVFHRGMRELGYVDGQNISFEYRFAEGKPERLPELAADLVRLKPDMIFALGGDVAPDASKATKTIPIAFAASTDPVRSGLVASLARPGGNATGVTFLLDELASKRLVLLKEAAPQISRVAFLFNPDHVDNELREAERAAVALGVKLHLAEVRGSSDIDRAFDAAARAGVDALYVVSSRQTVTNIGASPTSRRRTGCLSLAVGAPGRRRAGSSPTARTSVRWFANQRCMSTRSSRARIRPSFRCNSLYASSF